MEPYQGPNTKYQTSQAAQIGTGARRREPPAAQPRQETTAAAGTGSLAARGAVRGHRAQHVQNPYGLGPWDLPLKSYINAAGGN